MTCSCGHDHHDAPRVQLHTNRRADPTQTTALRKRLIAEVNKRWRQLRGEARQWLQANASSPITADELQRFMEWFDQRIAAVLLDGRTVEQMMEDDTPPAWVERRVDEAYQRGADAGLNRLEQAGVALGVGAAALLARREGRARRAAQMAQIAQDMGSEIHDTRRQVRRTVGEAETKTAAIAGASDRVRKVGQHRMRMLARTEVVKGHHKGVMTVYEHAEVEDVSVLAELQTAGDNRVCPECLALEARGPMPLAEAENLIPVHTGCRCTLIIVRVRQRDEREG